MAEAPWERTTVPGIYKREGARGRHYRAMYRDRTGRQAVRHFSRFEDAMIAYDGVTRTETLGVPQVIQL